MSLRNTLFVFGVALTLSTPAACTRRPASVSITPEQAVLSAAGEELELVAHAVDANGAEVNGRSPQWQSSDTAVATISAGGVVKAVKSGTTTITATIGGVSDTAQITVAIPATIEVNPTSLTLAPGSSHRLAAILRNEAGAEITGGAVSYTSDHPEIASVDAGGLVQALAPGSATLSVRSGNLSTRVIVVVADALPETPAD